MQRVRASLLPDPEVRKANVHGHDVPEAIGIETVIHILVQEACFSSIPLPADADINSLEVRGLPVNVLNKPGLLQEPQIHLKGRVR